jgi:uncharacterized protein involved in exopolysaccharide biosynthesis
MKQIMNDITPKTGNVRDVLRVIFKYKLLIIACICIALSLAANTNSKYKPIYSTTAQLLVKVGKESTETQTGSGGSRSIIFANNESRLNNEIEIITSRELAENVINKIGVMNIYPFMPVQIAALIFQSAIYAKPVLESNIINLSLRHPDKKNVAKFLNIMIEEYLAQHLKIYQQGEVYTFFDDQVKVLKDKIIKTSNELQQLKDKYNISELEQQKRILINQIYEHKKTLGNTRIEINEEGSKLEAQLAKEMSGAAMGVLEERYNPVAINAAKSRLNTLKLELEELLVRYKKDNILILNIKKEIETSKNLVDFETKLYYERTKITLQDAIAALKIKSENIQQQIFINQAELDELSKIEHAHRTLVRQDKLNSTTYSLYVKRLEEERISGAMDTQKFSNVYVIEKAYPPLAPMNKANKRTNLLISLVSGTFVGILIAFTIDIFNHCFNNREDIPIYLQLNVLASIHDITENKFKLDKLIKRYFSSG